MSCLACIFFVLGGINISTNTVNYSLIKPAYEDIVDIGQLNLNTDIIDTQLFNKADKKVPAVTGNLASLDATGNLADSGKVSGDFAAGTHNHPKSQITDFPTSMAPTAHKSTHAKGGIDELGAGDIGVSDATAAALGLTDATVNDALGLLAGDRTKVGDTLTTARTDLGDAWLLCNGESFDPTQYPDLANIIKNAVTGVWTLKQVNTANNILLTDLIYEDGYYVACGYHSVNYFPWIAFTTNLNGAWTTVQINGSYAAGIGAKIARGDGYWAVVGYSSGSTAYLFYSTSLTNTSWTATQIVSATNDGLSIIHTGTYWVIARNDGASTYIHYSTSITGTFTQVTAAATGIQYLRLSYENGYYIISGRLSTGYPVIVYATSPSGTWTLKQLSTSLMIRISKVIQYGSYYIVSGINTSTSYPYVLYATTISGTWTVKQVSTTITGTSNAFTNIVASSGYLAFLFGAKVFYATTVTGTWSVLDTGLSIASVSKLIATDTFLVAAGYLSTNYPAVVFNQLNPLPSASLSDVLYTFIKAKT